MGIDYTNNESKYLFSTMAAILNDRKPMSSLNRVNWGTIFRLSNFHKIANILYYAILGSDENMSKDVRKGFYIAFNEALLSHDRVSRVQSALFWKMDSEGIGLVVFRGADFNELYPFKEMGLADSLEVYVLDAEKTKVDELMKELDFTPSPIKSGDCIVYSRNPKCEIRVFFGNPFYDHGMKRYYNDTFSNLGLIENYKNIRGFDINNYYIFMISMIANNYALKNVRIRQLLDLWVFHKIHREDFDWDYITLELDRLHIGEMGRRFLELSFIWFDGTVPQNSEDIDVYDTMENYILSRGDIGFRESCDLFPLVKELNKLILEEQERIEKENYRKFLYPDKEYMQRLYPRLASNALGLRIAYFLRRIRLIFGTSDIDKDIENVKQFYEPQSDYPYDYYENTENNELEEISSAPLVVAGDVRVMTDVLPVNIGSATSVKTVRENSDGSGSSGFISEQQIMNQLSNREKNDRLDAEAEKKEKKKKKVKKSSSEDKKSDTDGKTDGKKDRAKNSKNTKLKNNRSTKVKLASKSKKSENNDKI